MKDFFILTLIFCIIPTSSVGAIPDSQFLNEAHEKKIVKLHF